MKTKALKWIWPALVALFVAGPASAEVSIDEILRLHNAGLSTQSLLLVVQASDTPDTISTDQLTAMLEAGVPDTVITLLVYRADAVAEDWQPVDVDKEVQEYRVVTRTQYVDNYYDPGWTFSVGVWWGDPYWWSYWDRPLYCDPWYDPWYGGWCATSWYNYGYGYYDPWYWRPRVCVNFGWYPFHYAWYPYYHGHHDGGYYAYYDHDYYDRGLYGRLRDVDRPDYRHTVNRTIVDASDGKSYRGTDVVRRGDAPLTELTRDYNRASKDVTRDRRTDLRDAGEKTARADDLAGRRVDSGTRDVTAGRFDRKSDNPRVTDKTQDRSTRALDDQAGRIVSKDKDSNPRSLFDRYGDEAKANAEKVERYRALKESQKQTERTQGTAGASNSYRRRTSTDASTDRRSGRSRLTRPSAPPDNTSASPARRPAQVDSKKEKKQSKEVAPSGDGARTKAPARVEPTSRDSSPRSTGRSARTGSSRSGGSARGDSARKRNP